MNPLTPKTRFQKGGYAEEHNRWAKSDVGHAAIEATLAHMAANTTSAQLMLLEGASNFAKHLLTIGEVEEKAPPAERRDTLSSLTAATQKSKI